MGKNSWIALLLALVVLVTTVPVCAAGAENPGVQAYREDASTPTARSVTLATKSLTTL